MYFKSNEIKLAGHLHLPDDYKEGEKRPEIVVTHPIGGVKEQTSGLYANKLISFPISLGNLDITIRDFLLHSQCMKNEIYLRN